DRDRPGHAALRKGRCSVPGWCYLVTTATAERLPWFAADDVAGAVAALHADPGLIAEARLLSWVLMPDHWHGIVQLGPTTALSQAINRFKTRTALCANAALGRRGAVWAAGVHDHALRSERELEAAREYIRMNPVRGVVRCGRGISVWGVGGRNRILHVGGPLVARCSCGPMARQKPVSKPLARMTSASPP
ncbi:MAG: transposase, partial [Xanthomonadales bacterium]|nr:transposase [Xanthomonadales bacterium]